MTCLHCPVAATHTFIDDRSGNRSPVCAACVRKLLKGRSPKGATVLPRLEMVS